MLYFWLKALHVAAVVVWAGGALVLAFGLWRLQAVSAPARQEVARMLGRWNAAAVSPAEGVVWVIGLYMAFDGDWWSDGWFHMKLTAALAIAALRGIMGARLRRNAADTRTEAQLASDASFGRIATFVILISIATVAAMVIVRPF